MVNPVNSNEGLSASELRRELETQLAEIDSDIKEAAKSAAAGQKGAPALLDALGGERREIEQQLRTLDMKAPGMGASQRRAGSERHESNDTFTNAQNELLTVAVEIDAALRLLSNASFRFRHQVRRVMHVDRKKGVRLRRNISVSEQDMSFASQVRSLLTRAETRV